MGAASFIEEQSGLKPDEAALPLGGKLFNRLSTDPCLHSPSKLFQKALFAPLEDPAEEESCANTTMQGKSAGADCLSCLL